MIRRCLRKDPALRYQDTADLKISLDELKQDSDSGTSMAYEAPPRNPRRRGWAVAAAVVLASAVLLLWLSLRKPVAATGEQLAIVRQLTFDSGLTTDPAHWPWGNIIAYASDRATGNNLDIWIQQIGGPAADTERSRRLPARFLAGRHKYSLSVGA